MTYADTKQNQMLSDLENRIQDEYQKAYNDASKRAREYWRKYFERDARMRKALKDGNYPELFGKNAGMTPEEHYRKWVTAQIARGDHWEKMRSEIALRVTNANEKAAALINHDLNTVFSLNYNYESYDIDRRTGFGMTTSFELIDENAVNEMLRGNNHSQFKTVSTNPKRDYEWNFDKIQSAITSAIIEGKSIPHLTEAFLDVMKNNRNAAIRNARTSYTSAQCAGRAECYNHAEAIGIDILQEWMSARDDRVRDSHYQLNGIRIKVGEKFPNGCRYPADPEGRPAEVYNCRCTTRAVLPKYDNVKINVTGHTVQTYKQWEAQKQAEAQAKKQANAPVLAKPASAFSNSYLVGMLGQKHCDALNAILDNCEHEGIKEMFEKYGDHLTVNDVKSKRGSNGNNGVNFNIENCSKESRDKYAYETVFHEFGHNIDMISRAKKVGALNRCWLNYSNEWKHGRLADDIKQDMKNLVTATRDEIKTSWGIDKLTLSQISPLQVEMFIERTYGVYGFKECGAISDMYGFYKKKSYGFCGGHTGTYYKNNPEYITTEFFAEMVECATTNKKQYEAMRNIFPTASADFDEIVKEITNVLR